MAFGFCVLILYCSMFRRGACLLLLCSIQFFNTKPRDWPGIERLRNDLSRVGLDVKP